MIRVFLSGVGCGATAALWIVSLRGTLSCVSLSFASGIMFTVGVLTVGILLAGWIGKKFGWVTVFTKTHSQHGGE